MMMFLGLAAINSQANLLFGVFGLMVGVLLVSGVVSRSVLGKVQVRRKPPAAAQVGRVARIAYDVTNTKRFWPSFSLTLSELDAGGRDAIFDRQPATYVLHAASGRTAHVVAEVVPRRRGWVEFERYQLSTSFPFGFIKRAVIRSHRDRLLVGPPRGAVDPKALTRFISAESSGLNQRPTAGGNDELFGLREYRPGDPARIVHWRRSARQLAATGAGNGTMLATRRSPLVVKEMNRVAPPRLLLLVDTHVPDEADEKHLVRAERALGVAASLAAAAATRGLAVGLLLPAGREAKLIDIRPDRGKRHLREMLTSLAEAGRNRTVDAATLLAAGLSRAKGDTTAALLSASAPAGAADTNGRRNVVTIPVEGEGVAEWVSFDDGIDWPATVAAEPAEPGDPG